MAAAMTAFALPTQALANCGSASGSYVVSCESGVKVYRHQAKSPLPASLSNPNRQTQSDRQADRRAAVAQQLEARRISIEERRQAAEESDLIRTRRGYNSQSNNRRFTSFGGRGFGTSRFNSRRVATNY